jgi:hypothetical protein
MNYGNKLKQETPEDEQMQPFQNYVGLVRPLVIPFGKENYMLLHLIKN